MRTISATGCLSNGKNQIRSAATVDRCAFLALCVRKKADGKNRTELKTERISFSVLAVFSTCSLHEQCISGWKGKLKIVTFLFVSDARWFFFLWIQTMVLPLALGGPACPCVCVCFGSFGQRKYKIAFLAFFCRCCCSDRRCSLSDSLRCRGYQFFFVCYY